MLNLNPEKINRDQTLATSGPVSVYPYQNSSGDDKFVVKIINVKTPQDLLMYFRKITLGFSCDNPYVLPVNGYYIDYDEAKKVWRVHIKASRMKGSLRDILKDYKKDKRRIPEKDIAQYFYDIVCGLEYLHSKGVAHGGIKPENVLFGNDNKIKIADYGRENGFDFYSAPENMNRSVKLMKKDRLKSDMWSLGIVLFELCSQMELGDMNLDVTGKEVKENLLKKLQEFEGEGKYSKVLIGLISSLLCYNPDERKNLKDLQGEIVDIYGKKLEMKRDGRKKSDAETNGWDQGLKAKLQEVQKELEARDSQILEIDKNYKKIVASLEKKLEKLEKTKKKELENKEQELRESQRLNEEAMSTIRSSRKSNILQVEEEKSSQATKNLKTIVQELDAKWGDTFEIRNELKKGIAIKFKSTEKTEEKILGIVKDATEKCGRESYEKLEQFSLNLEKCGQLTDEGLKQIGIYIGTYLKNLQQVDLNFYACQLVTDTGLTDFASYFCTNLKNVQRLNLNFMWCDKITDEGLKDFAVTLCSNMKTVQHLDLNFQWCTRVTDPGFKDLTSLISKNMRSLQHLSLNFYCTRASKFIKDSAFGLFSHILDKKIE